MAAVGEAHADTLASVWDTPLKQLDNNNNFNEIDDFSEILAAFCSSALLHVVISLIALPNDGIILASSSFHSTLCLFLLDVRENEPNVLSLLQVDGCIA